MITNKNPRKAIMTASYKGGVGKSTIAVSLARHIAHYDEDARVGVLNWDKAKTVTKFIARHGHERLFDFDEVSDEVGEGATHLVIDTKGSAESLKKITDYEEDLDALVIVCDTGDDSLEMAAELLGELDEWKFPAEKIFVLINKVNRTSEDKYHIPYVVIPSISENFPGVRAIKTFIPLSEGIKTSIEREKGTRALTPIAKISLRDAFDELLDYIK
jgi:cellulose biosynthesis protein BcsQ